MYAIIKSFAVGDRQLLAPVGTYPSPSRRSLLIGFQRLDQTTHVFRRVRQPGELDESFTLVTGQLQGIGPGLDELGVECQALHVAYETRATPNFPRKFT